MDKSLSTLVRDREFGLFGGVIHIGDVAYDLHDNDGKRGDEFLNRIEPVAAWLPYHLTPGTFARMRCTMRGIVDRPNLPLL